MKKINLEQFKPKAHPFRPIFRRHKVTGIMLANYLEKHVAYVNTMLCGHLPMSKPVYEKLSILVKQLDADEKESTKDAIES